MKIGFDVSDLATNRADGTTRYTREMAGRLPLMASQHEWHLFAPRDFRLETAPNSQKHISPWPKYWTQLRLPFDLYTYRPDVLLMPIQQIPYLRPKQMKTVATVHDLAVHKYPEQFQYRDWALLHVFSAYVARQADVLIADSHATAQDIAHYYGRTEKVYVVHLGLNHEQFRLPTREEKAAARALHTPYMLYVGQIQPRKNLVRFVEAFEEVHEVHPELSLVIAGGYGWLQQPIVDRIKRSKIHDKIILTGVVPDALLPALYWHAEAFILPSLYEGFGMPILEAMACGCPVVTSNVSSMPEVAGDAAVLVDPTDTYSITHGIYQALARKEELKQRGLARAQEFSWDKTAGEIVKILESV